MSCSIVRYQVHLGTVFEKAGQNRSKGDRNEKKFVLTIVASLVIVGCAPYIISEIRTQALPPKAPGCAIEIINEGKPYSDYLEGYEYIGTFMVKEREVTEKAKNVGCSWGADALVYNDLHTSTTTHSGQSRSFQGAQYDAMRKLSPGESPSNLKALGITDEKLKEKEVT